MALLTSEAAVYPESSSYRQIRFPAGLAPAGRLFLLTDPQKAAFSPSAIKESIRPPKEQELFLFGFGMEAFPAPAQSRAGIFLCLLCRKFPSPQLQAEFENNGQKHFFFSHWLCNGFTEYFQSLSIKFRFNPPLLLKKTGG